MTLYEAIEYTINKEGLGIISESRLRYYLADLQAYESPAVKRIVSTMIDGGDFECLFMSLSSGDYELQFKKVESHLIKDEGFQEDFVRYVLACILFATHKIKEKPQIPNRERAPKPIESKKQPTTQVDIKLSRQNDEYIVELNKQTYKLNESQYKAIVRKQDMPTDRLLVWLTSYEEENNSSDSNTIL